MQGLTFEEESHEYRFNGLVVPSVTRILAPLTDFGGIPFDVLEFARLRGSAVHEAIALFNEDDLDESDLDPVIVPYLEGWKRFLTETGFVPEEWEARVYHPSLQYAGTFDAVGMLGKSRIVLDYKTGKRIPPSVGPQLAAYQLAINAERGAAGPVLHRYALHLPGDGSYDLRQFRNPADLPVFQACLAIWNFHQENR